MKQNQFSFITCICIVLATLCIPVTNSQQQASQQNKLMDAVAQQTIELALHAKEGLTQKCVEGCVPPSCSGHGDIEEEANQCLLRNEECNNCHVHEKALTTSGGVYDKEINQHIKDVDYLQRKTMCQSKFLDQHFVSIYESTKPVMIYITYEIGVQKIFPGIHEPISYLSLDEEGKNVKCTPVDVRSRPFYAAATTGIKQLVIILDMSHWMTSVIKNTESNETETYWDYSKRMLYDVTMSLTPLDHVGVVVFNRTSTYSVGQPPPATFLMGQATTDMLDYIQQQVDLIDPGTHTTDDTYASFHAAIDLSYSMLADLSTIYSIEEPNPVIVLISGKDDCSSSSKGSFDCPKTFWKNEQPPEPSYILDIAKAYNQRMLESIGIVPRFFTFSIDPQGLESNAVSRLLACSGNAAWTKISGLQPILDTMRSYRYLLSSAISKNKNKVSWAHIYEDRRKVCNMTTASKAVFDNQGVLQGVLGIDLCIEAINVTTENYIEKLKAYYVFDKQEPLSLDQCDMQIARSQVLTGDNQLDQAQVSTSTQCAGVIEKQTCYVSQQGDISAYYYIGETISDWVSADVYCTATGGLLASIGNMQTASEVVETLQDGNYWIGLKGQGPWKWSNSSISDATENEPWWLWQESISAGSEEQCGYINRQGIINNVGLNQCSSKMKFVCQYNEKPSVCSEGIVGKISDVEVWESGQGVPPLQFCIDKRASDQVEDLTDYNVPEQALCDMAPLHKGDLPIKLQCCDNIAEIYQPLYEHQCIKKQPKKRISSRIYILLSVGLCAVVCIVLLTVRYRNRQRKRRIADSDQLLMMKA